VYWLARRCLVIATIPRAYSSCVVLVTEIPTVGRGHILRKRTPQVSTLKIQRYFPEYLSLFRMSNVLKLRISSSLALEAPLIINP